MNFSTWQNIYAIWIAAPNEPGIPCFIGNGETPEEAIKDCEEAVNRWKLTSKDGS